MVKREWGGSELRPRLFSLPEEAVEVSRFVKAVVVHWVTMLADLSISSPVAERVRGDAEILSGFLDSEVTI